VKYEGQDVELSGWWHRWNAKRAHYNGIYICGGIMPEYFLIRVEYGDLKRDVFMERFTDGEEAEEAYATVYKELEDAGRLERVALYLTEGTIRHNPFVKWPITKLERCHEMI
jgi:hypothetical protein